MKRFFEKYKILLSVILLLIILAGVIGYLFYAGILTIDGLKNLGDGIVSSLNKAGGGIKTALDNVVDGVSNFGRKIVPFIKTIWGNVIEGISSVGKSIVSLAKRIWNNIIYYLSPKNPYFYYVIGFVATLILFIILRIAIKNKKVKKRKFIRRDSRPTIIDNLFKGKI